MLLHLAQAPTLRPHSTNEKLLVYSGISYDLKLQKGDIIFEKSFTSTSILDDVAKQFIRKNNSQNRRSNLLVIELNYGKDIAHLAAFKKER